MLAIIRFPILLIYFILINIFLVLAFVFRPMHRNNVYLGAKVYASMRHILGYKLIHRTAEPIDYDKPYVFVANHQNTYDLATVSYGAEPGVVTVGKKSLKWIPIFGLIYWLSGNIMIDRKNSGKARGTLKLTGNKMRAKNLSVWMFPEGTRSRGRGLMPFKTGAFRLAVAARRPIIPVVCSQINDNKIRFNRWDNGTVIIETLAPIEVHADDNPKELAARCYTLMLETFERISKEAEELSNQKN